MKPRAREAQPEGSSLRAHGVIALELEKVGLDARPIDGWVYVALPDGRLLHIGAEYGQSLDASLYAELPEWFLDAERPGGQ